MPRNTQVRISKLLTVRKSKSNKKLNSVGLYSSTSSEPSCKVSSQGSA